MIHPRTTPAFTTTDPGDQPRFVECAGCNGEGVIEHITGYDPRDGEPTGWSETCRYCNGSGEEEIEPLPVDLDDLDEISPATEAINRGVK